MSILGIPSETVGFIGIAIAVFILWINIKKIFARPGSQAKSARNQRRVPLHEIAHNNAQKKEETVFNGDHKPNLIAKWEAEFFELTRQMNAQIDTKMSMLSQMMNEANRVCQRLNIIMEQLERRGDALLQQRDQENPPALSFRSATQGFASQQEIRQMDTNLENGRHGENGGKKNERHSYSSLPPIPEIGEPDVAYELAAIGKELFKDTESQTQSSKSLWSLNPNSVLETSPAPSLVPTLSPTTPQTLQASQTGQPETVARHFIDPSTYLPRSISSVGPFRPQTAPPTLDSLPNKELSHITTTTVKMPTNGSILKPVGNGGDGYVPLQENIHASRNKQIQMLLNYGLMPEQIAYQLNISLVEVNAYLTERKNAA